LSHFPLVAMGCASSNSAINEQKPDAQRRRLSVGHVEGTAEEATAEVSEEDRGLLSALSEQTIINLVEAQGEINGRKMSIGSNTDTGKTSFANKTMQQMGDEIDPVDCGLGYTCRKGLKPESPNQDSWFVLKVENHLSIYGVFDGHGQKGHHVSQFVKENLPKLIMKDPRLKTNEMKPMLNDVFKKTQALITYCDRCKLYDMSAQMSGTTATVAIHDHVQKKLTTAHVADSTAVLGKTFMVKGAKEHKAEVLTRDHKPDCKDEKERIEARGGRVVFDGYANHRIYAKGGRYPGLNMSRCLGDLMGHMDCGIIAEPEVSTRDLTAEDSVLLLCSDGVWEFISATEAVNIVMDYGPSKAMMSAERLAKESWDRWIKEEGGAVVDDITVVLVYLNQAGRKD